MKDEYAGMWADLKTPAPKSYEFRPGNEPEVKTTAAERASRKQARAEFERSLSPSMSGEKKLTIAAGLAGIGISICLMPIGIGFLGLIPSFLALRAAGKMS